VGGGDDADVDVDGGVGADADDLALLEDAEELDLGGEGHVADFVEQEGAAVGVLEASESGFGGAGEGALGVAEELALEDALGQGAAVEGDEAALAPPAVVVEGAGDELLACAALAVDEDGGVGGGDLAECVEGAEHAGVVADDALEAVALVELLAELEVVAAQVLFLEGVADDGPELLEVDRLAQVGGGPLLHGGHGVLDGGVARDEDDLDLGVALLGLDEDLHAVHLVHHEVGDDEVVVGLGEAVEPLAAAGDDVAVAGEALEGVGEGLPVIDLVVNDDYSGDGLGGHAGSSWRSMGRRTVKWVPLWTWLSTSIVPPCSSRMRRVAGRPRPLPLALVEK